MITYFSTAKNFNGKPRVAQLNAIRSWQHSVKDAEIIIFGNSEGTEELAGQKGIILQPGIEVSPEGTPHIDDMFIKAQQMSHHDICCFINADIIITRMFSKAVIDIHQKLSTNYLVVGQRYDINLNRQLNFEEDGEINLDLDVIQNGHLHPPWGSDYFAFPKDQYKTMPSLLVGRGGWDLWMIFNGRMRNLSVIDLSPTVLVYHQNHDYSHRNKEFKDYEQDDEALENLRHLPDGETYDYTLLACNYVFEAGKIKRNFARNNLRKYIRYRTNLLRHKFSSRIVHQK